MTLVRVASRSLYIAVPRCTNVRNEARRDGAYPVQYVRIVDAFQRQLAVRARPCHIVGGPDFGAVITCVTKEDPVLVAEALIEPQHQVVKRVLVDALDREV